ncbi:hypothetical protein Ancab_030798 [Ancistrocladus abbreviatus]
MQKSPLWKGWTDGTYSESEMKQVPGDYLSELEEHGSTMAMEVDDVDPLEIFGEGLMTQDNNKLVDSDFFNSFEDDFDDSDVN